MSYALGKNAVNILLLPHYVEVKQMLYMIFRAIEMSAWEGGESRCSDRIFVLLTTVVVNFITLLVNSKLL